MADARSDIFAVGVILYEMLTGKRAFHRATSVETMTAILNEDPPAISQLAPNLPPGLQESLTAVWPKVRSSAFNTRPTSALRWKLYPIRAAARRGPISPTGSRRVLVSAAAIFLLFVAIAIVWYLRPSTAPLEHIADPSFIEVQTAYGKRQSALCRHKTRMDDTSPM